MRDQGYYGLSRYAATQAPRLVQDALMYAVSGRQDAIPGCVRGRGNGGMDDEERRALGFLPGLFWYIDMHAPVNWGRSASRRGTGVSGAESGRLLDRCRGGRVRKL